MATAIPLLKNGTGKRKRNEVDLDDAEFAPLSKRINNLHLHQLQHNVNAFGSTSLDQSNRNDTCANICDSQNSFAIAETTTNWNESCSSQNVNGTSLKRDFAHTSDSSSDCSQFSASPYASAAVASNIVSINVPATSPGFKHHNQEPENFRDEVVPNASNPSPQTLNLTYTPSLSHEANPYYYEPNKQLYMLYLERINRTAGILHPHFFQPE